MINDIKIRKALIGDINAIYNIELDRYGEAEATELQTFKNIVDNNNNSYQNYRLVVASNEAQAVLGFYCLGIENNGRLNLYDVAVKKDSANNGIGQMLLHDIISFARSKASFFKIIHLKVRADNIVAAHLYLKCGFTLVNRLPHHYGDVDGLYMEYCL